MELNVFEIVNSFCHLIKLHNSGLAWNPQEIEKFFSVNKIGGAEEDFVSRCTVRWMQNLPVVKTILSLHRKTLADEKNTKPLMDSNVIEALLYLFIFETESLPIPQFAKVVYEFASYELLKLLRFLTAHLNPDGIICQPLLEIYDASYVHEKVMEPLRRQRTFLLNMSNNIEPFVVKKKHRRLKKSLTVFNPFNLTKPQARIIPPPETLSVAQPRRIISAPATTYIQPQIFLRLQEQMLENKKRAQKLLEEIRFNSSHYQQAEKSERTLKRMAEILEGQDEKLQFNKWKAIEMPNLNTGVYPVKKNVTAVLREGSCVEKQLQEQLNRIKALEGGEFAAFDFHKWQQSVFHHQWADHLNREKELHTKTRKCLEDAKLAKKKAIKANREKAKEHKEKTQLMLTEAAKDKMKKEQEMKEVINKVMMSKQQMKESMKSIALLKHDQAQAMQIEYQTLKTKAEEHLKKEKKKHKALIDEIRILQMTHLKDQQGTVTVATGGVLSAKRPSVDLKAKLKEVQISQQQEEQEKRKEINRQKRCKQAQLKEIENLSANLKANNRLKDKNTFWENWNEKLLQEKQQNISQTHSQKKEKLLALQSPARKNKDQELKTAREHLKDLTLNTKNH